MKDECVGALCKAAGYSYGGIFKSDTGDACKTSYQNDKGWAYFWSGSSGNFAGQIKMQTSRKSSETAITAFCANEPIPDKQYACGAKEPDCKGVPGGSAVVDQCGVCDGDNKSCADCKGMPNGNAKIDKCGVCGGDGTSCKKDDSKDTDVCDVNG